MQLHSGAFEGEGEQILGLELLVGYSAFVERPRPPHLGSLVGLRKCGPDDGAGGSLKV